MNLAATEFCHARTVPSLMDALRHAEIRARIREARKRMGLSQEEFAELLNVSKRSMQNYEGADGVRDAKVPWDLIDPIAQATGVSVRWLLHGDESHVQDQDADVLEALRRIETRLERLEAQGAPQELLPTAELREMMDRFAAVVDRLEPGDTASAQSPSERAPRSPRGKRRSAS